jgi:hypothetical protein
LYLRLCVLIVTIAFGAPAGHCEVPQAGTSQIAVQSSAYSGFRQLFAREAATATVTVRANLGFPEEAKDRYPAVVVVHTIGGYREANEGYAAAELRKSGFATLTYDSFGARGTTGLVMSRSETGMASAVADAYAALRLLTSQPKIDVNRIAIVGFSFGGEVAHLAAFEPVRSALNLGQSRFAPTSPAARLTAGQGHDRKYRKSRFFAARGSTCCVWIKLLFEPRATLSATPIGSDPLVG